MRKSCHIGSVLWVLCCVLLSVSGRGVCDSDIPYYENFESAPLGGLTTWHSLTAEYGTVEVQSSTYKEGTRALAVTTGTVVLSVTTNAAGSNRWFRLYVKPTLFDGTADDPPAGKAGGFYVTTNGALMAYSSNAWTNCMSDLPTNDWLAFAVHIDYANSNWDLYVDTNASYNSSYGMSMIKANGDSALMFSTDAASTNRFVVTITNGQESAGYFDLLAVSPGYTNCAVTLTNVFVSDRLAGKAVMIGIPPCNHYTNTATSDTLDADAELGIDLARGLGEDDRLRVYTNAWQAYEINGGSWQEVGSATNVDEIHIGYLQGLWLERAASGGTNTAVFYPFQVTTEDYPGTITVNGTDDEASHGWTVLSWPGGFAQESATAGWDFDGTAANADEIYVYENNRYFVKLWWDGSAWKQGQSASSYTMKPGQGFWYKRKDPDDGTWAPAE